MLTIYKSFVRLHLDYGGILYNKPENNNFHNKVVKVQYRVCLDITGAVQGTSRLNLYDELGLHSVSKSRWRSNLFFLINY